MLGLARRFKSSDLILKSKLAELNQNKKSQQPDWPEAVWKLYFTLVINHTQHICLHVIVVFKIVVLKVYKKIYEKGAKLVFFNVQHIFF